ncbi:MAG: FomA family porin-like outer membrane protein [Cetobacterium sp.]
MKKLALLLGSLLVVGATASAKESVVAPVEVSKEVVVVAEPVVEVVEEAFRPFGYAGLEYRAYGETEGHGDKVNFENITPENTTQDSWNRGANNYSRLQTVFGVQMTEKSRFDVRVRDYNNLDRNDVYNKDTNPDGINATSKKGTETRLRYKYQHTPVFASQLQYRDEEDNSQNFEYRGIWKAYSNKGALLSALVVEPYVLHSQPEDNGGAYSNMIGTKVQFLGDLFAGFNYEFNTYLEQTFYNHEFAVSANSSKDKELVTTFEAYLYNSLGLYSNESLNLDLNFEGGYDAYGISQYGRYDDKKDKTSNKNNYQLYTTLDATLTYQITPAVSVNTGVGAEYRNWKITSDNSAKDWRWQPFAFAGMNVKF